LKLAACEAGRAYPGIDIGLVRVEPFIMLEAASEMRKYADALFRANCIILRIVIETTSGDTAFLAVECGMGSTFAGDDPVILKAYPSIRYLECERIGVERSCLNMLHKKGFKPSTPEESLIVLTQQEYA
jgi:DNA-binding transcriptional LysR family regulator